MVNEYETRAARRSWHLLLLVTVFFLCAPPLSAQPLDPGQRVRIEALQARQSGSLLRAGADSVILQEGERRFAVATERITRLDVSRGTRGHPVLGAVVGAAAGGVAAFLLFNDNTSACTGSGNYAENCRWYRAGIIVGAAGLGALVGTFIRTERWEPVPVDAVRANRAPGLP